MDVPQQQNAAPAQPVHDSRPICAWCGRGRVDVIGEWRDSNNGVIGFTLKCDAIACARLTVV